MESGNSKIIALPTPRPRRSKPAEPVWKGDLDLLNSQLQEYERLLKETCATIDRLCSHLRRKEDPKIVGIAQRLRRLLDPSNVAAAQMTASLMALQAHSANGGT